MKKPNINTAYEKVVNCIEKCTTQEHLEGTKNLILNFSIMFQDEEKTNKLLEKLNSKII
jgi:hypothetical protein